MLSDECFPDLTSETYKTYSSYNAGYSSMTNFGEFGNNSDNNELEPPLTQGKSEESETALARIGETFLDKSLEKIEESPLNHWMEIASPILKSGGKPVTIILALGFISIPLMVSGSPWVALTLAIGASATAICSCFSFN